MQGSWHFTVAQPLSSTLRAPFTHFLVLGEGEEFWHGRSPDLSALYFESADPLATLSVLLSTCYPSSEATFCRTVCVSMKELFGPDPVLIVVWSGAC